MICDMKGCILIFVTFYIFICQCYSLVVRALSNFNQRNCYQTNFTVAYYGNRFWSVISNPATILLLHFFSWSNGDPIRLLKSIVQWNLLSEVKVQCRSINWYSSNAVNSKRVKLCAKMQMELLYCVLPLLTTGTNI